MFFQTKRKTTKFLYKLESILLLLMHCLVSIDGNFDVGCCCTLDFGRTEVLDHLHMMEWQVVCSVFHLLKYIGVLCTRLLVYSKCDCWNLCGIKACDARKIEFIKSITIKSVCDFYSWKMWICLIYKVSCMQWPWLDGWSRTRLLRVIASHFSRTLVSSNFLQKCELVIYWNKSGVDRDRVLFILD